MPSFQRPLALLALAACASCVTAPTLDPTRLVDLSHGVDASSPTAPDVAPFEYRRTLAAPGERWSVSGRIDAPDRSGAYLQSPLAFGEGRRSVEDFVPAQWIGPIRVIDVSRSCDRDRNYLALVDDLRRHERFHGRIQPGTIVLVRTGWDSRWSTRERYFGFGQDQTLNHPGVSVELARELVGRGVEMVGIDAPDIDGGLGSDHAASRLFAAANVPLLGNLAGLSVLPPVGATLIAAPFKIRGGATAPVRAFAIVP